MNAEVRRRSRRLFGPVAAIALITAACGSDGADVADVAIPADEAVTAAPDAADDTTGAADAATPQRIVSLSPTHTEILFALGADERLVAVDDFSDYPAGALELPNELSGFEPNVEAIASFEPDLVITGGDFTGLGEQLAQLGIGTWDGPAAQSLDDTYRQIEDLGAVVGREAEAEELVAGMTTRIADAVAAAPRPDEPPSFYHELDPTLYSADSTTFIGEVYDLFGLRNIADGAGNESFGFPQLNAEYVVSADPDIIFLADTKCCAQSLATVAARPGWEAIAAVRDGNVVEMDDDIASRSGPRVVDYVEAVAVALASATTAGDSG